MADPNSIKAIIPSIQAQNEKSSAKASTRRNSGLLEWPTLPELDDSQISPSTWEEQWLDHRAPVELGKIPIDCPSEVINIIQRSMKKETYIQPAQQDDGVVAVVVEDVSGADNQPPARFASRDDDAVSSLSSNSSDRSPTSESRSGFSYSTSATSGRSMNSAMSWLATKGAKAGKERVKKFLKHKPSMSLTTITRSVYFIYCTEYSSDRQ
jgi:hypothetical protein